MQNPTTSSTALAARRATFDALLLAIAAELFEQALDASLIAEALDAECLYVTPNRNKPSPFHSASQLAHTAARRYWAEFTHSANS